MKTIHGAFFLAILKRSLILAGPTPTTSWINSEAEIEMKGTPADPDTALASKVFPVPGGPDRIAPLGIFAPSSIYLSGYLRKSTSSITSSLASSIPAMSSNVTSGLDSIEILAFDLPIANIGPNIYLYSGYIKRHATNTANI